MFNNINLDVFISILLQKFNKTKLMNLLQWYLNYLYRFVLKLIFQYRKTLYYQYHIKFMEYWLVCYYEKELFHILYIVNIVIVGNWNWYMCEHYSLNSNLD